MFVSPDKTSLINKQSDNWPNSNEPTVRLLANRREIMPKQQFLLIGKYTAIARVASISSIF